MAENALRINALAKVFGGLAAVGGVSLNVAAGERRAPEVLDQHLGIARGH